MGRPLIALLACSAKNFCAAIRPVPKARLGSGSLAATATCSSAPMMAMVSM